MRKERHNIRRDRILMIILLAVTMVTGGLLVSRFVYAAPPKPETVNDVAKNSTAGHFSIAFGGDTMLADGAMPLIEKHGYSAPMEKLAPLLAQADYSVINLETPVTTAQSDARAGAKYSYATHPDAMAALKTAGVKSIALANNHAMDRGIQGLTDTLNHAREADIRSFGAGMNDAEAMKPLIVESTVGKISIVNLSENYGPLFRATPQKAGGITFSPTSIQRGVDQARAAGAKKVVAFVHWGDNYGDVTASQRHWAQMMVDAGYDAIIGAGPHSLQPVEIIGGIPVFFSIGNFAFGAPGRFADYGKKGVALFPVLGFNSDGQVSAKVTCLKVDNTDVSVSYQSRACTSDEAKEVFEKYLPGVFGVEMSGTAQWPNA